MVLIQIFSYILIILYHCLILEKWAIVAIRNFGLLVLEVVVNEKLLKVNEMRTNGGEGIVLSNNKKYAYLKDGQNGVTIIDL